VVHCKDGAALPLLQIIYTSLTNRPAAKVIKPQVPCPSERRSLAMLPLNKPQTLRGAVGSSAQRALGGG
jgi:hypothetical protein